MRRLRISPVKKIDDLCIHELPAGRPLNVVKAIKCDGFMVFIGKNGRLYSGGGLIGSYPMICNKDQADRLMSALLKIGIITQQQHDEHVTYANDRRERNTRRWESKYVLETAASVGLKFTSTQRRFLRNLAKGQS